MIEANNVIKKYGQVTALDDFTVDIPKGKIGILGPNGAGKSTFVKIALGLIEATSGNITVLGENLDKNSIEIRKKIGYMPEHDCIPNKMTGVEFLIEMGLISGLDYQTATQRTHEILGYLRMGEEKYRLIEEYSGGMRQKIKLAQGLVHGPEIMFLDEPTSGLDPNARQEMLETINGLAEISDTNVLLSTHILQDVETVCDYVIIINNGKLQIKENVKELIKRQTDTIQIRIGENSEEFLSILKLNDAKRNIEITERWIRIPYKDDNSFKEIISAAAKANSQLYEMERVAVTMDNIYLEVVN
ncbi:MAG: ABC transporter ATP-binding protein [Candidatus Thermoplasmatota archaeon]|nr:ABC transporter ATP-binding protein [Candidatus Thermoplasmatota archaeon]